MAVVGTGYFGRFHAEKIARLPQADLVGIADIDAERAAEIGAQHGVEAVTDYRDLIGKVDAVSIAVPTHEHYNVAREFLANGVDVLVEKPITSDAESAEKLIELARSKGRILQVGHLERFAPMIQTLRQSIHRPLFIDSVRIAPFKPRGTDVSVILDLMSHDLDLILSLVDSPIVSVDAAGAPVFSDLDDIVSARLKFANGCVANIVASRISLKTERRMRIFEPDQYANINFDERTIRIIRRAPGSRGDGYPKIETLEEDHGETDLLQREIESFVTAVVTRNEPLVSGEAGLQVLKAAQLVSESLSAHARFVRQVADESPPPK